MPKATITFNLPEESTEFQAAVHSLDMRHALEKVVTEIFRPARKHGYPPGRISDTVEKIQNGQTDEVLNLIAELEKEFWTILEEYDIRLY